LLDPKIAVDEAGAKVAAARMAPKILRASMGQGKRETVEAYSKRSLDDRVGRVFSVKDDVSRIRDHVLSTLGPLDARTFTCDDVETLRDELDEKIVEGVLAWKTVASVWTLVTSICGDMVAAKKREFRLRDDNPSRDVKPASASASITTPCPRRSRPGGPLRRQGVGYRSDKSSGIHGIDGIHGTAAPIISPAKLVRRGGIEPPTRGFSVPCSTD
jgi:hypothetical protein